MMNNIVWSKPDPPPNALRTAFTHAHETLLWASKGKGHTFNYDLVNSPNPSSQVSSVWRIAPAPRREKLHGSHPTQKPLRLVRRALLASTREGELVFDPFCGSGTTGVAAKELECFFVGVELEKEYCKLASGRIADTLRGSVLTEIPKLRSG
jgi:site-specific DNA-methyltransferase (adenine-specific)